MRIYFENVKLLICFILFILGVNDVNSQSIIYSGEISSEIGPLPYVNIGIPEKNIGTISDKNGMFKISIPQSFVTDTLYFSHIGFKTKKLVIDDENKLNYAIKLDPISENLEEVVIENFDKSSFKKVSRGTKGSSRMVAGNVRNWDGDNNDIVEFAKLVKIKNSKALTLENVKIKLFLVQNPPVTYRINFYEFKDGLPGKKIVNQEVLFTQKLINGWNTFDLASWDLIFDKNFFVSVEYIPNMTTDQKTPFRYSGKLLGKSIKRTSSLGSWGITTGATISIYVEALESAD